MLTPRKRFIAVLGISSLASLGLAALILAMQTRHTANTPRLRPLQEENPESISDTAQSYSGSALGTDQENSELLAISASVDKALSTSPLAGSGIRLLSVQKQQGVITLNFSQELLNKGTGAALEDRLHQILTQIGNLPSFSKSASSVFGKNSVEFQILVQGRDLESLIGK